MEAGLYVSLSSQIALERRLNTLADNLANVNTVGFRSTGIKFNDLVSGTGENSLSFASTGKTYLDTQSGGMRQTGNPLDFAIQGDAWFSIQTPDGQVLTRDGRFAMNDAGELLTLEGYAVLDAGGAPIQLDPRGGEPNAGADGMLFQNGNAVGAIGLFAHQPGTDFVRYGNSGIVPQGAPEPIVDRNDVGMKQGFLEESNVNPVVSMTQLIMVQRAFENTAALTRSTETSFSEAIKTLGSRNG
jgi:flagellar basal-body rod protein FlgF